MARRLRWFVGLGAIALVMARLGRVLEPAVDTADWRLLVPTAVAGGVVVTWATARLSRVKRIAIHAGALFLLVARVAAPETLLWGFLPTTETPGAMAEQLLYGLDVIRFGAPPVLAVAGVSALAATGMWMLGGGWASSISGGPTWAGIGPPLAFYLYLAVVDRNPSSLPWNIALVVVGGLGLVATANPVSAGAGHMRSGRQPVPRWHIGPGGRLAAVSGLVALVGTPILTAFVPAGGAVTWRTVGGEGTISGGGFSASRFVDLRQSLVSLSDEPVFVAVVDQPPPAGPSRYWRMLTLDRFNGEEWAASRDFFVDVAPGVVQSPAPETITVTQTIQIESLSDDRLPSLFAPQELYSNDSIVRSGVSLGGDGNLRLNALTREGLSYQVTSQVPRLQLGLLASVGDELSPLFAEAVEQGEISISPVDAEVPTRPAAIDSYLAVPDAVGPAIGQLAREVTAGAESPFERALLLEHFFQTFQYSTDVSTGHSALDLEAWLTDPESPNYRTGYCEQFAASMALMGRIVGLPTRVVIGFTPGETVETEDGPIQVVRERNAHAWVEVWFDGQGWVGFDPTPRSDGATAPTARAIGLEDETFESTPGFPTAPDFEFPRDEFVDDLADVPIDVDGSPRGGSDGIVWSLWWLIPLVGVLVGSIPGLKALRRRHRHKLAAQGDVAAAWAEIIDRLEDLGDGPAIHQTPVEFASQAAEDLLPLARAYSASVYGGVRPTDAKPHLLAAERWLERRYDPGRLARSRFRLRSLLR